MGNAYFPKREGDAFSNPAFGAHLAENQVDRLILAGVYADGCLAATAEGALRRGYGVTVLSDAVAAATPDAATRACEQLARQGARVQTTADVLGAP
ncbi:nicotinamidase/pyrazinamidase [compost metagenome]